MQDSVPLKVIPANKKNGPIMGGMSDNKKEGKKKRESPKVKERITLVKVLGERKFRLPAKGVSF